MWRYGYNIHWRGDTPKRYVNYCILIVQSVELCDLPQSRRQRRLRMTFIVLKMEMAIGGGFVTAERQTPTFKHTSASHVTGDSTKYKCARRLQYCFFFLHSLYLFTSTITSERKIDEERRHCHR